MTASIFCGVSLRADTSECPTGRNSALEPSELAAILNAHEEWVRNIGWSDESIPGKAILCGLDLGRTDLSDKVLRGADFRGTRLAYASLRNADLRNADFTGASLIETDLQGARADFADFSGAHLTWANLSEALLRRANFSEADLSGTELENSSIVGADITGSMFSPASPPKEGHVDGLQGLATVRIPFDVVSGEPRVAGLSLFRTQLKKSGLRSLERQATYAIERSKTSHALDRWLEDPIGGAEAIFRLVAFELTVAYGLHPGRAILAILVLIIVFSVIYEVCQRRFDIGHIVRVWPSSRVEYENCTTTWQKEPRIEVAERGRSFFGISGTAFAFSVVSAFNIGWKDLNVGNWIQRLQTHEAALQGVGWLRSISGTQSLISVYLLAMWALTYFGRPFG